jgi:hypothetical protein
LLQITFTPTTDRPLLKLTVPSQTAVRSSLKLAGGGETKADLDDTAGNGVRADSMTMTSESADDPLVMTSSFSASAEDPHAFRRQTFWGPTWCAVCQGLLIGLREQGLQCANHTACGYTAVHAHCAHSAQAHPCRAASKPQQPDDVIRGKMTSSAEEEDDVSALPPKLQWSPAPGECRRPAARYGRTGTQMR